jgi:hypothetical protein
MKEITVQLVEKIAKIVAKELVHHQISPDEYETALMIMLNNALLKRAVDANDDGIYHQRLKEIIKESINFMKIYPNLIDKAVNNPELHHLPK